MAHILMISPELGGEKGGIYILPTCLMKQLKKAGAHISCVLGVNRSQLSEGDKDIVSELNVTIIEPEEQLENYEIQPSVQERISIVDNFNIDSLPQLSDVDNTVCFGLSATCLAAHMHTNKQFRGSKIIVITSVSECSKHDIFDTKVMHGVDHVFCLGYKAFRFLNTEVDGLRHRINLLMPDFRGLFDLNTISQQSQEHTQTTILIPWLGDVAKEKDFIAHVICAIHLCNATFSLALKSQSIIQIILHIPDSHTYSRDFAHCCNFDHVHQLQNLIITRSSVYKMLKACRGTRLVVTSGGFTEIGYSGLEFFMNKIPTLVLEDSDVALIMQKISTAIADNFVLKTVQGVTMEQRRLVIKEWERKIILVLDDSTGSILMTERMVNMMINSETFVLGNMRLQDALGYKRPPGTISKTFHSDTAIYSYMHLLLEHVPNQY